jgi:hypothetical protein
MKAFIVLWAVYAMCVVAAVIGLIYVAIHFLSKVW